MPVHDLASPDFDIPENKDGFFSYNEEKNLQSIGEKHWANKPSNRRLSESSASSAGLGLRASSLTQLAAFHDAIGQAGLPVSEAGATHASPFFEDEEREVEAEAQVHGTRHIL